MAYVSPSNSHSTERAAIENSENGRLKEYNVVMGSTVVTDDTVVSSMYCDSGRALLNVWVGSSNDHVFGGLAVGAVVVMLFDSIVADVVLGTSVVVGADVSGLNVSNKRRLIAGIGDVARASLPIVKQNKQININDSFTIFLLFGGINTIRRVCI